MEIKEPRTSEVNLVSENNGENRSQRVSEDFEEQVEWLVNTRPKRATAGNRLNALLLEEEPDDELQLLFAEDEEDTGFHDVEADLSDVQMDSSTDEEDQGPIAEDNFEGEEELQKAMKDAQVKKKKKRGGMFKTMKKVRIDTAQSHPTPQPKKKSERASWLPISGDVPVRASSRGTTRQSKQELHAQMMDREIKRLKQLANMEKIATAKAAKEKPPLTQEDRLKEAARIEKSNSKSLSRWEEAEREREEEQRQKLVNSYNRRLEGPVITLWSGMATYVEGKLQRLGKVDLDIQEKSIGKKRKVAGTEEIDKPLDKETESHPELLSKVLDIEAQKSSISIKNSEGKPSLHHESIMLSHPSTETVLHVPSISSAQKLLQPPSSCLAPPAGFPLTAPVHPFLAPPSLDGSSHLSGLGIYPSSAHYSPFLQPHFQPHAQARYQTPVLPATPVVEKCLRSSLIFSNFPDVVIKNRETQLGILFPHIQNFNTRTSRASRIKGGVKGPVCAITGYPAKYKDSKTGLYYHNLKAYKEIQKLQRGEVWWSDLVGLFVGSSKAIAARGVPERFKGE